MYDFKKNNRNDNKNPIIPKITKNNEEFLYPISYDIEFSTICPDIIGHTAIAKFYTTNIIPKAVPVIFLLTTIGIEGIIQLA